MATQVKSPPSMQEAIRLVGGLSYSDACKLWCSNNMGSECPLQYSQSQIIACAGENNQKTRHFWRLVPVPSLSMTELEQQGHLDLGSMRQIPRASVKPLARVLLVDFKLEHTNEHWAYQSKSLIARGRARANEFGVILGLMYFNGMFAENQFHWGTIAPDSQSRMAIGKQNSKVVIAAFDVNQGYEGVGVCREL